MHSVTFTQATRSELIDAQDWYEHEVTGLGLRFLTEVDAVVARISANPWQFPTIHKHTRRALMHRFPYALMFVVEPDDSLTVVACFHGSRNPNHWKSRI